MKYPEIGCLAERGPLLHLIDQGSVTNQLGNWLKN